MIFRRRLQQHDQCPRNRNDENNHSERAHVMVSMKAPSASVHLEAVLMRSSWIGRRQRHAKFDAGQSRDVQGPFRVAKRKTIEHGGHGGRRGGTSFEKCDYVAELRRSELVRAGLVQSSGLLMVDTCSRSA